MENECARLRRDFSNHALYNTFILNFQFSITEWVPSRHPSPW